MLVGHLSECELRVTGDRGQRIVQIVGDAARQPADGLHFLGVAQLIFEVPAIRDVLDRADHANGLSVVAAENVGALVNPAFRAVTADYPMLDVVRRPALDRGQARRAHDRAIGLVNEREKCFSRAVELTGRHAENTVRLGRPAELIRSIELGHPAADVRHFLRLLEQDPVQLQRLLGVSGLADVAEAGDQADDGGSDPLRRHAALEHPSVLEPQHVEHLAVRVLPDGS